jgi:hypothetical protein
MITASWGVAPENEVASGMISTFGQVRGNMLLDTGAGFVGIDNSVAQQLKLHARSEKEDVHGLGGKQTLVKFNAALILSVELARSVRNASAGATSLVRISVDALGIEGLGQGYASQSDKPKNGLPVIGILGRAFLQFTKFTYDGLGGGFVIEIDESFINSRTT